MNFLYKKFFFAKNFINLNYKLLQQYKFQNDTIRYLVSLALKQNKHETIIRENFSNKKIVNYNLSSLSSSSSSSSSYPFINIPLSQPIPIKEKSFHLTSNDFKTNNDYILKSSILPKHGLQVISTDCNGYVANIGLYVNCGTRWENSLEGTHGYSRFMEHIAFQAEVGNSNNNNNNKTIATTLEELGAHSHCTSGREHIEYHLEVERGSLDSVLPSFFLNIKPLTISELQFQHYVDDFFNFTTPTDSNVETILTEALHNTAWFGNTLGHSLITDETWRKTFTLDNLKSFIKKFYRFDRMLVVGVNVDHDDLCNKVANILDMHAPWTDNKEKDMSPSPLSLPAHYVGGKAMIHKTTEPLCHLAIGYHVKNGWNSSDLFPLSLLQMILGGGGAFSTGGPGKGMYTRLYLEVLTAHWAESCTTFNTQYSDSGLFGLYITGPPTHAYAMVRALANQFHKIDQITDEELYRSKNALKSSIWMNLEHRSVLVEDMARQFLLSGKILSGYDFCRAIDSVTSENIGSAARKILQTPPTIVALGDLKTMPDTERILSILNTNKK